jgi:hypothetical protein
MENDELLRAINAIKAGDKQHGQVLLSTVLNQNPRNENAWLWLAVCQIDNEKKKYCLERASQINPSVQMIMEAMEYLKKPIIEEPIVDNVVSRNNPTILQKTNLLKKPKNKFHWLIICGALIFITAFSLLSFYILNKYNLPSLANVFKFSIYGTIYRILFM